MEITVKVIHAFSRQGKGGNPAGVVFDADRLTTQEKQRIAAGAGFPETAFVSASMAADYKLDFFTPLKQIPHCGHATIATFNYLKKTGRIRADRSSKETIDGLRTIIFKNGLAFMEQRSPVYEIPAVVPEILKSIGAGKEALLKDMSPVVVNTGNSFLIIPLRSEELLRSINYDKDEVTRLSEKLGLIGYYLFAPSNEPGYDATTRMFAPFYGIDEEAGTGMAAGPLACYLYHFMNNQKNSFKILQGNFMQDPSPSLIEVELVTDDKGITQLFAGGDAYVSGEKIVEIN